MRISIKDYSVFIGHGDPISTDWIVYVVHKDGSAHEVFRSMDDTKHIFDISPTMKYKDGTDVYPEKIATIYCEVRLNFDKEKHGSFYRFQCNRLPYLLPMKLKTK